MKYFTLASLIILLGCKSVYSRNSDWGLQFSGGSVDYTSKDYYYQNLETFTAAFYLKFYSDNKRHADKFLMGVRGDDISFENYAKFHNVELDQLDNYNVKGRLERSAMRLGYEHQFLFGKRPNKFGFAIVGGAFYELTTQMERFDENDNSIDNLYFEINRHNWGMQMGVEATFGIFVLGFKYEGLFFDMLNREYINSQNLEHGNSSELRGLNLTQGIGVVSLALQF